MPWTRHPYHNLLQIKKEKNQKALYLKVKKVTFRAEQGLHSELWLQTYNFHCNIFWNLVEDAISRQ